MLTPLSHRRLHWPWSRWTRDERRGALISLVLVLLFLAIRLLIGSGLGAAE